MLRQTNATGETHEAARDEALVLSNARVVTPSHVLHGSVVIENGKITEIHEGPSRHADALAADRVARPLHDPGVDRTARILALSPILRRA